MDYMYLLDVRTKEEWDEDHAKGANHIPLDELLGGHLPKIDKDSKILVYCRSGNRSAVAKQFLESGGFLNTENIRTLNEAKRITNQ